MAHITCSNCGEVFEDQEFCPQCGQWAGPLPESRYEEFALGEQGPEEPLPSTPPSRVETIACPSCGAANPSTNRHCEQCGARLSQGPLPVAPQPIIRTTAGARALVIILGTVAVVALFAFIVNSIFGGKNGTVAQSTTTSSSTTTLPAAVDIPVITETCSSELNDKFSCTKLFDDDPETYWNDASAKGVGATITATFPQAYKLTQIIFTNVADDTKYKFDDKYKAVEDLGKAIQTHVSNALYPKYVSALKAGSRLEFGPLALDQNKIYSGNKELTWDEVKSIRIQSGFISVKKDKGWFRWAGARVPQIPNFFIFYALLKNFTAVE